MTGVRALTAGLHSLRMEYYERGGLASVDVWWEKVVLPPDWEGEYWTNRDLAYPRYVEYAARQAYEMAGVTEPRKQIHIQTKRANPATKITAENDSRYQDEKTKDNR